jgi:hypothetical protein
MVLTKYFTTSGSMSFANKLRAHRSMLAYMIGASCLGIFLLTVIQSGSTKIIHPAMNITQTRLEYPQLNALLANHAGLSKDFPKTVWVLSANMGYADMIFNMLCQLNKTIAVSPVVIAQDKKLASFLGSHGIAHFDGTIFGAASESTHTFRTKEFNYISKMKLQAVRTILKLGYDVLFSDVDIGLLSDPLLHIPTDVDLSIQANEGTTSMEQQEPNTGIVVQSLASQFLI